MQRGYTDMDKDRLSRLRPYAFHLTARENLSRIRRVGRLESAQQLCTLAGRQDLLAARRGDDAEIVIEDDHVLIRDQRPLYERCMDLGTRPFGAFLADLNRRVFFWAGSASGLGRYGAAHYERYRSDRTVVLRVSMVALLEQGEPELCRYNSGAPRPHGGRRAPRGLETFVPLTTWNESAARVVEVTFRDAVALPAGTEWSERPESGSWLSLLGAGTADDRGPKASASLW